MSFFCTSNRSSAAPICQPNATDDDLKRLRREKVALVAAHGIEVGLAVTAYPDKPREIEDAVAFALESPHVCYLLVTLWRDVSRMPAITGDLATGMFSSSDKYSARWPARNPPRRIMPVAGAAIWNHAFCFSWLEPRS